MICIKMCSKFTMIERVEQGLLNKGHGKQYCGSHFPKSVPVPLKICGEYENKVELLLICKNESPVAF